ncbi:hypothetical protein AB4142_34625, partial [Variovorax sp. 2RAF20]
MRALTVTPGEKDSLKLRDVPEPATGEGEVLAHGPPVVLGVNAIWPPGRCASGVRDRVGGVVVVGGGGRG